MSEKLNITRLGLGVNYEVDKIKDNWHEIVIATFILVLIMISYLYFSSRDQMNVFDLEILLSLHKPHSMGMLLIGYLWVSIVSKDYLKEQSKLRYITLPLNTLEKYLAKWIVSFLMFNVFYTFLYYVLCLGLYQVMSSYEKHIEMPPFFGIGLGTSLLYYGIFHSVILYLRLEFSVVFSYVSTLVYFAIFVVKRIIDFSTINFYELETYYAYNSFFLTLLGIVALPLGYYAIKNKQLK